MNGTSAHSAPAGSRFSALLLFPVAILTPSLGFIPGLPFIRLEWVLISLLVFRIPKRLVGPILPPSVTAYFMGAIMFAFLATGMVAVWDVVSDRSGSVSFQTLYFGFWPLIAYLAVIAGARASLLLGSRRVERTVWVSGAAASLVAWAQVLDIGNVNSVISPLYVLDQSRLPHLYNIGFGRAFGTTGNPNTLACLVVIIVCLGCSLALTRRSILRPSTITLGSLILVTVFLTLSRSGILIAGLAAAGIFLRSGLGRGTHGLSLASRVLIENWVIRLAVVLVFVFASQLVLNRISEIPENQAIARLSVESATGSQSTLGRRFEKWDEAIEDTQPLLVAVGWYGAQSEFNGLDNEPLRVLLSFGGLGLISLTWLWVACWKLARHASSAARLVAMSGVVASFIFSATAFFFLSYQLPVVLCIGLGALIGVVRLRDQSSATPLASR